MIGEVSLTNIPMPCPRPANVQSMERCVWEKEVNVFIKRKSFLHKNMKLAYIMLYKQCLSALISKVEIANNNNVFHSQHSKPMHG
eukprot:433199-Ditylum_brightwellii.AAC.1